MMDLLNKTIGPYQIVGVLGRGGMGTVYRAIQPSLNRNVAIKVLPDYLAQDEEFIQRFRREATTVASLQHPNILTIYDVGKEDNLYYIVMQLLEGRTLAQVIETEQILPLVRTNRILAQITSAVDYAHQHAIIHRDIKPANIFIGPDDHATLMDFGIVKALSETRLTRTGVAIGTPEYMSPEQVEGQPVDFRSDLYAVGVVLYQMLTGQVPFTADTPSAILYAHVHRPPVPPSQLNPTITPDVEAIVLKALAKEPSARYQSGIQLSSALAAAAQQAESAQLDTLYARALQLTTAWKLDEALTAWEQLLLIKPGYKDAAAQMERVQRQQEARREYHALAGAIRQVEARAANFTQHHPDFPDTEGVLKAATEPGTLLYGALGAGIMLLLGGLILVTRGTHQVQSAQKFLPSVPEELSFLITLFSFGNFNLGLGIGLAIAGACFLIGGISAFIIKRRASHHSP